MNIEAISEAIALLPVNEQEAFFDELDEYRASIVREEAEKDFLKFVHSMWPGFINGRHHKVMARKFEEIASGKIKRLIVNMPPRHAIMVGMKIPTTHGFKTMSSLNVGDFVFGPDGQPVEVLGKSNIFHGRELYRVWTDDRAYLDVDGEHLWTVRLDRKHGIYNEYTTEQLWRRQNGEVLRTKRGGGVEFLSHAASKTPRLPMLPDVSPVEYPGRELLVDPYVLGVWLGDGSSASGVITSQDADAVVIRAEFERRGTPTTDQAARYTFGTLGLQVKLKGLGVLGNKHIPREYLEASPIQRRDLLKGLMDTDGNVSKAGQCFFAQSDKAFIEQVAELVRSLGVKASVLQSEAKIGSKSYGPTWKISFYASDVFLLPRKEERTLKGGRTFGRYIRVEKLSTTGDTQCIKVDREDGLFLAGEGYICTHNTKSEFASYLLPAWFLGKYPNKKIIQTSNTAELAVGFGRKVRNLVGSEQYAKIFPNVNLRQDSKAAGRWSTNKDGEYFAIGVGGTVTGKGADLLIIDDPHSEQEAALASGDPSVFDKVYEWYTSGPRQRLQPGGSIIVVMCMTGDTNVLMADGGSTRLKDIRPGDMVATFDNGRLVASKVNNWRSSGVDSIYTVQTQSGIILRANERHPFLVMNEGVLEWTRLKDLKPGMLLVATKGAADPLEQKQNPGYAPLAKLVPATTEKIQTRPIAQLGITGSGKGKNADVGSQLKLKGCAVHATQSNFPQQNLPRSKVEIDVLNTGMGLLPKTLYGWLMNVAIGAMSVGNSLLQKIQGRIGTENYVSTTTITPEQFAGYSAMTATSQLDTAKRQMFLSELRRISDFTTDPIISITPAGREEVFDVEIDRTENFIANGVVSHNTRWAKRDLTGRILQSSIEKDGNDDWEVIDFPAILPSDKPLWPEFWSLEELEALRSELPVSKWNAQYQQSPTSEEGAIVKREWWKEWKGDDPPKCEFLIQSWDTAFLKSERADYSACTTWGVFYMNENENDAHIILLDAFKRRMEFPELKAKAFNHYKEWEPDAFIVEAKASGAPLIFELRAMGIPVQEFTPSRGNDKMVRINSVSDLFASGKVWAPSTRWADELIEEMAAFPNSDHDDLVDSATQALIRFRKGGFIRLQTDEQDEIRAFRRKVSYY